MESLSFLHTYRMIGIEELPVARQSVVVLEL